MIGRLRCIDLFSGLGGFSEAMLQRGWDVFRYDFDSQFEHTPNTIIANVLDLDERDLIDADIILASPPCNHFSIASVWRHWNKDGTPSKETKEQIELVRHTIQIIKEARPKFWILENPRGMLRKVIGKPDKTVFMAAWGKDAYKPTDLWGRFPPIDWLMPHKWEKAPRGAKTGTQNPNLSPAERALIPYDFSLAVCLAVEGKSPQTTLDVF